MTLQAAVIYGVLIGVHYVLKGFLSVYIVDEVLK